MDTNQLLAALSSNNEQVLRAAYNEGVKDGYAQAAVSLQLHFEKWKMETAAEKKKRGPRNGAEESEAVWLTPDEIKPLIKTALATLQLQHPDGAGPQLIAEQLHPGGKPVNVQAVRQALRQLTMQGEVRRVAHARYLPAAPIAEPEPQPEAAE